VGRSGCVEVGKVGERLGKDWGRTEEDVDVVNTVQVRAT